MSGSSSLFGRRTGSGLLDTAGLDMSSTFGPPLKTLEQSIAELLSLAPPPPPPPAPYNALQALLRPAGLGSAYAAPRPVPAPVPAPVRRKVFSSRFLLLAIIQVSLILKSRSALHLPSC